jgi:hypothetical protein
MIDLRGGSSSADLEPLARSILSHTTVKDSTPHCIPHIIRHSFEIPEFYSVLGSNVVKGEGSSFGIKFYLDSLIADASADIEGLDSCSINAVSKTTTQKRRQRSPSNS